VCFLQILQKHNAPLAKCNYQNQWQQLRFAIQTMKTFALRDFFTRNNYVNSFVLFSLWLHIQTAITSMGYHHADEHFQILEPLGWKMGLYDPQDLAWEFTEKIRPGLQILLGWCIGKGLVWGDAYSPFLLVAILRQLSGLLWAMSWAFYKKWKPEFNSTFEQKALLVFTALLWFLPYLHVRYSSESWGGLAFFSGLFLLQYPIKYLHKNMGIFLGALLMGLSFYFRFQMGFAILGYVAWALWFKKFTLKTFGLFILGGLISAVIGTAADYWLYNHWVITPYNYFFQNIVANKAAGFGTSPFYSYITMFIETAAPPISIVLLVLLLCGLWAGRKSPYTWALLAFVGAHSVVAHKEFRFMFPMVMALPIICMQGIGILKNRINKINPLVINYGYKVIMGINLILMAASIIKPASEQEALFKAFYIVQQEHKGTKIAFDEKDPFDCGLQMNFFRYCNDCFYKLDATQTIDKNLYLYTWRMGGLPQTTNTDITLEYSAAPIFSERLNFGHWQERTNKGFLWKITRKGKD
jgi:GPI mannosyltransferase 3